MITEQDAIERAKRVAEEQAWGWAEPAVATLYRPAAGIGGKWEIFSGARGLGSKARVVIDAESGAVLEKGYIPR